MRRHTDRQSVDLASARGKFKNPIGSEGVITRGAEYVPLLNTVVQEIHRRGGHGEALARARERNPIGPDGKLTRGLERVPIINNLIQGVHRLRGEDDALDRAKEKNPLGKDGFVTQASEMVPGLADLVVAMHGFVGNEEAQERAKAHSLQKLASKDGALIKVAQLIPVANLFAGALLEAQGEREEAIDAINILKHWKNVNDPDGALFKVAEQLPGTDVFAFWQHLQGNRYARALRSITKTAWVDVLADELEVIFELRTIGELRLMTLHAYSFEIRPKSPSLVGGCIDAALHFLDQDRLKRASSSKLTAGKTEKVHEQVTDMVVNAINDILKDAILDVSEQLPDLILIGVSWPYETFVRETEGIQGLLLRALLPPALPKMGTGLQEAIRSGARSIMLAHRNCPTIPEVRPSQLTLKAQESPNIEPIRAVAGVACASCVGGVVCCSPTLAIVGCLGGCAAGIAGCMRLAARVFVPGLNAYNAAAGERSWQLPPPAEPPEPIVEVQPRPAQSVWDVFKSLFRTKEAVEVRQIEKPAAEIVGCAGRKNPAELKQKFSNKSSHARKLANEQLEKELLEFSASKTLFDWVPIKRRMPIPVGAVVSGSTQTDGVCYSGRFAGEAGKINVEAGNMYYYYGHFFGRKQSAEILVLPPGTVATWKLLRRGDKIPAGAVEVGRTAYDGINFVGRFQGEAGKINTKGGNMWSFWGHHNRAQKICDILVLSAKAFSTGDRVEVWSDSSQTWVDGVIEMSFDADGVYQGFIVQAGMVKVVYSTQGGETRTKYVAPDQFSVVLRRRASDTLQSLNDETMMRQVPTSPIGLVAELPRGVSGELSENLIDYVKTTLSGNGLGQLIGCVEKPARKFLSLLVQNRNTPLPLVIDVELPAFWIDLGPAQIWLPTFSFGIIIDLRLDPTGPLVWRVQAAVPDAALTLILEVLGEQIQDLDIRKFHDDLTSFTEPIRLNFDIQLDWQSESSGCGAATSSSSSVAHNSSSNIPTSTSARPSHRPRVRLQGVQTKLHLPP